MNWALPGATTAGPSSPPVSGGDIAKEPHEVIYEKETRLVFSKSLIKEKIKQFKLGKYTEKYIRTYLEFALMEGIIDNLTYLEYLKEIGEKV